MAECLNISTLLVLVPCVCLKMCAYWWSIFVKETLFEMNVILLSVFTSELCSCLLLNVALDKQNFDSFVFSSVLIGGCFLGLCDYAHTCCKTKLHTVETLYLWIHILR